MGTFLGHIYPGLFIALIALRNLWIELRSFYTEEYNHNQLKSKNDLKNNLRESIFYIVTGIICSLNEILPCLIYDEYYFGGHSYQHMTIFIALILYGVIRIIVSYKLPLLSKQISDFFYLLMGSAIYFMLTFHLHGRTPFDTHVHNILIQTILFTTISYFVEIISNSNLIFSLIHKFCLILTGSWLCQIGFYLYPPWSWLTVWDQNDIKSIIHANNIFSYHMIMICLTIIIMMSILSWKNRRTIQLSHRFSSEHNLQRSSVKQFCSMTS
ncbi:unnamed protein product [Schistosoma rodhaini]|nr:unnamed protein product [Schistosoma rodhaini]